MRRYTDAEHGFGDIIPTATVHIRPVRSDDQHLKIQNYDYLAGQDGVSTRTVGVCGTTAAATVTACYVSIPPSACVYIDVIATAFCTAGTAAGSGMALRKQGMAITKGGSLSLCLASASDALSATWASQSTVVGIGMTSGASSVGITFGGVDSQTYKWVYEVTTLILTY